MLFAYVGRGTCFGRNGICEQDGFGVVDPGGFPLRTLGRVGWTSCTTRRLAWSSTRFAALEICRIS